MGTAVSRQSKRNRSSGSLVGIAALLCIFVGAPLAGTGNVIALILLALVIVTGVLLWRPLQAWAARLESSSTVSSSPLLEQRVQQLEALIDSMSTQNRELQERLHWQERLLQQSSAPAPQAPTTPDPSRKSSSDATSL